MCEVCRMNGKIRLVLWNASLGERWMGVTNSKEAWPRIEGRGVPRDLEGFSLEAAYRSHFTPECKTRQIALSLHILLPRHQQKSDFATTQTLLCLDLELPPSDIFFSRTSRLIQDGRRKGNDLPRLLGVGIPPSLPPSIAFSS